eukprot:TRINITY_DN10485_c0_g1_i1.p1 TRINITY_DN10485_c0_g1~~TRINITY_DN10485_c0_g1_i1.p1  ORF type:complete len:284 (+),score=60.54 TRINITY_DN10485_c0_g1_i1:130-981(+)
MCIRDRGRCKVRPVHIFIGIACALTLCGFVMTVYGGVKIYYHDVFKGMTIQSKEIYAKDLSQMYKMFKRIAFFQRKHPEFIDCGHMRDTQLEHMDTFDLKKSYINANYEACVEKKMNVIFFPVVSAMLGVLATLFSMFSVYRGRSGVFVFSAALLAISLAVVMVAIQLVTHNTMDVRVKWSCDYVDGLMPSYECCNMVCSMFVERDPCYATCFNSKFCVDCCDSLCMGVRSAFRIFLAGAIQLIVSLFMMLFVVGSSFRTRKSSSQAGPQDLMLLFRAPDYSL